MEQGARITVRWPDELVGRIDAQRGEVSRSAWLRAAAEAALADPARAAATLAERPSRSRPVPTCKHTRAMQRGLAMCDVCGARL